jgi:hypothetical protein
MVPRAIFGWPLRAFCFTLVGVLTFVVHPNGTALKAQFAGYLVRPPPPHRLTSGRTA